MYSDFLAALKSSGYETAKRILDEADSDSTKEVFILRAVKSAFYYENCFEAIEWLINYNSAFVSSEFVSLLFYLYDENGKHDSDENWFSARVKVLILFAHVGLEWNAKTSEVAAENLKLGQIDCLFGKLLPSIDVRLPTSCLLSYAYGLVTAAELKFCEEIMSCYCFGQNGFDGRGHYVIDTWMVVSNMRKRMVEKFPDYYRPMEVVSLDEFPSAFEIKDVEQLLRVVDQKDMQYLLTQWCLMKYRILGWGISLIDTHFNYIELLRENSTISYELLSFCMSCITKKNFFDWMEVDEFCSAVLKILPFCEENFVLSNRVQLFIQECLDRIRRLLPSADSGDLIWRDDLKICSIVAQIGFSFVSQNTKMRSSLHSLFSTKFDFSYLHVYENDSYDRHAHTSFVKQTTLTHWVLTFWMILSRVDTVKIHLLCGVDPHVKDGNGHTPLTSFLNAKSLSSREFASADDSFAIVRLFYDYGYHFCVNHDRSVHSIHKKLVSEFDFIPKVHVPKLACLAASVVAHWKDEKLGEFYKRLNCYEIREENRALEIPQHLQEIVYRH